MNTKELRIGNLITDQFGETFEVSDIHEDEVFNSKIGDIPSHGLLPIPLTEGWLIAFGFEKNVKHSASVVYEKTTYECAFSLDRWEDEDEWFMTNEQTNLEIKHVHQLQNLYFALCGKELKIETT